jgi:hypothetical protein
MDAGTIATIVVSVITTAVSVSQQAKQSKKAKQAAERKAQLDTDRLANEQLQRDLQRKKTLQQNQRTARRLRSTIRNTGAAQNILQSTAVTGAAGAVSATEARNVNFVNQNEVLAKSSDAITRQQIDLNKQITIDEADDAFTGALISGVGGIATQAAKGAAEDNWFDFDTGSPSSNTPSFSTEPVGGGGGIY